MRFPWPVTDLPTSWTHRVSEGITTLFEFPLRRELDAAKRHLLADRLMELPVTAVLFLKHLEQVDIEIDTKDRKAHRSFRIERRVRSDGDWTPCRGFDLTSIYGVSIQADAEEPLEFLMAHDGDVEIGAHRGGLAGEAWNGVTLTEVSVATSLPIGQREMPSEWRRFHVFLPTNERLPHGLIVNGAFVTDLSRQEIRLGHEGDDYNSYLAEQAARLVVERLIPAMAIYSVPTEIIRTLDRGSDRAGSPVALALHSA